MDDLCDGDIKKVSNHTEGMTPDQADGFLQRMGFFDSKGSVIRHHKWSRLLISEAEMVTLGSHFNGQCKDSEKILLNLSAQEKYFEIIHSTKYDLFKQELIWLDAALPEELLVADLGCNTGHITNILSHVRPKSRFIGYDRLPKAIDKANALKSLFNNEKITFEIFDVFNVSVSPKPDLLLSLQGIGYGLLSKPHAEAVCRIADQEAFLILIEKFSDEELATVTSNLSACGFNLLGKDSLEVKSIYLTGTITAAVYKRN